MAIITISRQFGSLGTEIAQALEKKLNYASLEKKTLEEALVSQYGIAEENIDRYDEKKPPLWDVFSTDKDRYLHFMKTAIYNFAKQNNCIIIGRGGQVLLRDIPGTLHVRVLAPKELRIKRLQERFGYDDRLAGQLIRHSDHDRVGFHKFFFHINWEDVSLYDLMINTQIFSIEQAAELIEVALEKLDILKENPATAAKMEDLCLGQTVVTEIAYKEKIPIQFLEAVVTAGTVTLKGSTITSNDIQRCEEIARGVPGVKDVVNEVYFIPNTYGMA